MHLIIGKIQELPIGNVLWVVCIGRKVDVGHMDEPMDANLTVVDIPELLGGSILRDGHGGSDRWFSVRQWHCRLIVGNVGQAAYVDENKSRNDNAPKG